MLLQNQIERLTSMNKKLRIGLMLLIVALIAMPEALAVPSHLTNFTIKYPFTAGTRIDSCDLCHIPPFPSIANRNAYGFDFGNQTLRFTDPNQSFANIELNDSDGDGFTNIAEINALTFPGNASDHPNVLTTIAVSPQNATVTVGNNMNFTATTTDQLGNPFPVIVTWNSSNTTVGTINAAGMFTALAVGTATITASNGTVNGTTTVTVILPILTSINVTPQNPSVLVNGTMNFIATPLDQLGNPIPVTVIWNSSNTTVGTIDAVAGIFTALTPGTSIIMASNGTVNGTTTVTVTTLVRGDVNGNGALDVTDTLFTLQAVAGLRTLTAAQTSAADVNGNGVLDITDGLFIAQAVAGLRILI